MSRQVKSEEIVKDILSVFDLDGYTKKAGETTFTTQLFKDGAVSAVSVDVSEIGSSGDYLVSFTPDDIGVWEVQVLIDYNKDWWGGEYQAVSGTADDLYTWIKRILGLNHENIFIDNTEYDANTQLVLARVRLFDSRVNCDAATDGGSETTGLVATYQLTSTWEGLNQFRVFKQTIE